MENHKEFTKNSLKFINQSVKFQATKSTHKNQSCFHTPTMSNLKKKLRKHFHL